MPAIGSRVRLVTSIPNESAGTTEWGIAPIDSTRHAISGMNCLALAEPSEEFRECDARRLAAADADPVELGRADQRIALIDRGSIVPARRGGAVDEQRFDVRRER